MQPKNHFRFKKTDWTKPVEFRLSKCKTDTIRKKKVQQMFADI